MAQRTAADCFLRSAVTTAGARVLLAPAVAALLLAGCGGDSSNPADSAGSTTTGAAAQSTSSEANRGAPERPSDSAIKKGAEDGGAVSAESHKRGPRIAQPKGAPEEAPSPAVVAHATVADMTLQSPAIVASGGQLGRLAPIYTCDGRGSWPALHWGGVPDGSAELILYAMSLQPVEGQLFVDWAVAGLDPSLEEVQEGRLPAGAIVGTNGFGKRNYEICPGGGGETYMFALYALPERLSPRKGFDARELRKRILDVSGNVGLLPAVYERG